MQESKYLHLMHTFVDACKEGDEEKRKAMLYNLDISDVHEEATSFLNVREKGTISQSCQNLSICQVRLCVTHCPYKKKGSVFTII